MTCDDCIPDKRGSGSPDTAVLEPEVKPETEPEVEPETKPEVNILSWSHLGQHELAIAPYALFSDRCVLKMPTL